MDCERFDSMERFGIDLAPMGAVWIPGNTLRHAIAWAPSRPDRNVHYRMVNLSTTYVTSSSTAPGKGSVTKVSGTESDPP